VALRDLGVHRLKDLSLPEQIFQLIAPDLPSSFAPLQTLDLHRTNLPAQPTPLIGRGREIAAVAALLRQPDVRLVTLCGPGGTGKTRLGLQVTAELLEHFADGSYFVNLAPISDPSLVATTIAHALGLAEVVGRSVEESLHAFLRAKQALFQQLGVFVGGCTLVAAAAVLSSEFKVQNREPSNAAAVQRAELSAAELLTLNSELLTTTRRFACAAPAWAWQALPLEPPARLWPLASPSCASCAPAWRVPLRPLARPHSAVRLRPLALPRRPACGAIGCACQVSESPPARRLPQPAPPHLAARPEPPPRVCGTRAGDRLAADLAIE
jgi:hypothetical protein